MFRVLHRHRRLLSPAALRRWESAFFRLWAANHLANRHPAAALVPAWNRVRREPLSLEGWRILGKCTLGSWVSPERSGSARQSP
jgi:hypothetical protein